MNVGWYVVYILMVIFNQILCNIYGFNLLTWQNWAWSIMLILCFVSGSNYLKEK